MKKKQKTKTAANFRDRVKDFRRVKAKDLTPADENWREHEAPQRNAYAALLEEIGFAGALTAREQDGKLILIDGQMRLEEADPDDELPTLILDVTAEEATKLLLSLDPIAAMATANKDAYRAALESVETKSAALQELWDDLAGEEDDAHAKLKPLKIQAPPKMTWVLLGIPTVRYGEIVAEVEAIATIDGIVCEITSNDGEKKR